MSPRIAIVVHVFYAALWDELAECLCNFSDYDCRLFVTTCDGRIAAIVRSRFPSATVMVVPNVGYDIAPFFMTLDRIALGQYDLVVKLHTKRDCDDWINGVPIFGAKWRERLLSFCKTKAALAKALELFDDPRVGMVAHGSLIVGRVDRFWESEECLRTAVDELSRIGLEVHGQPLFVAGTMFIVRSRLLACFQNKVDAARFSCDISHRTGSLAHSYERALGYAVGAQGCIVADFAGVRGCLRTTEFLRIPVFLFARWFKRHVLKKMVVRSATSDMRPTA